MKTFDEDGKSSLQEQQVMESCVRLMIIRALAESRIINRIQQYSCIDLSRESTKRIEIYLFYHKT
jgi:hypothetical protein